MAKSNIPMRSIGRTGLNRWGGYVYEEFITNLRWPNAGKVYQEMSDNDPVVGAVLYLAEMMIRKTKWTVEPASEKAKDVKAAEFLESCIYDMDVSWEDTICEIISMMTYGFSFHEVIYKLRRGPMENQSMYRSKFKDGKVGWKGFPIRSQNTLHEWEFEEETGDIVAFWQMAPPYYKIVRIPLERGLLFRTRVSRDNPEGKSLLRNAYRPWYFKKRIEEIEGIGIERDLAGFPVLKAPEGLDIWNDADPNMVSLLADAMTLVQNIRRDSEEGLVLPFGWDLSLLSTGSSRQFDTNAIINRYDNRIAIVLLSDIILIGNDKTGSFALADTKKSLLASALFSQLLNIANIINKYQVPKLMYYNNFTNLTDYPKLVPGTIETPTISEIAILLRAMGLDITKDIKLFNFVRKVASMPILTQKDYDSIYKELLENQQALEEAKLEAEKVKATNDSKPDTNNADFKAEDKINNQLDQEDMRYTGQ